MSDFKIVDAVQLTGGGPGFTVHGVHEDGTVLVTWITYDDEIKRHHFPPVMLRKIHSQPEASKPISFSKPNRR